MHHYSVLRGVAKLPRRSVTNLSTKRICELSTPLVSSILEQTMHTLKNQETPPPKIRVIDEPRYMADWPYKWRFEMQGDFLDIDMDWDDPAARQLLFQKINGFGAVYIQQLEPTRVVHSHQLYMFRIAYTFDLKDPEAFKPSVIYRRPMYRFRLACMAIRECLTGTMPAFCKAFDEIGFSYIEAPLECVQFAAMDICRQIASTRHKDYPFLEVAFNPEHVRAVLEQEGLNFDTYILCPEVDVGEVIPKNQSVFA